MSRHLAAVPVITLFALSLCGCELDQAWVDRHDARVRQVAEASWCETGQRPRTGLTVIAASRAQACKNARDRLGYRPREYAASEQAARDQAPQPKPVITASVPPAAHAPPAGDRRGTRAVPVDEITQAASRSLIPIESEHAVAKQCLAACPALSDPDTSDELVSHRNAVCHETCMVKNLPAASPNRDMYEKEAERDLDAIRRLHTGERP